VPYHVRINFKDSYQEFYALDKDADWIEQRIAEPIRKGRDAFIDGQVISWPDIREIHIVQTEPASTPPDATASGLVFPDIARWNPISSIGLDVTEQFITGPPGTGPRADPSVATIFAANRKAVMVIYGHDKEANTALFDWLRAIGLQPQEWSQLIHATGNASPYIGQVLDKALQNVQAVIAYFTPDEYVTAAATPPRDQSTWRLQARPNVLIEAGMALITHPTRTVIAVLGNQELPSDLAGRHYIRLSHTDLAPLQDLAARLHDAGCDTSTSGTDWLNPARFPNRDTTRPPPPDRRTVASTEPGNQSHDYAREDAQARKEAQRTREDTDARQVTVVTEAKNGANFTHLITVSTPTTYPIKLVDAQIAWQTNSGLGMTSPGFVGDPPRTDDHHRRYTFRASVSPQIRNPEPVIRFVDQHGHRYYQFRDHTQRFPQNTDWPAAAAAIDQWLRTGPSPD
jgi:predicted nucleotide-binding protein